MATNAQGDIGPQGLLDYVVSELARELRLQRRERAARIPAPGDERLVYAGMKEIAPGCHQAQWVPSQRSEDLYMLVDDQGTRLGQHLLWLHDKAKDEWLPIMRDERGRWEKTGRARVTARHLTERGWVMRPTGTLMITPDNPYRNPYDPPPTDKAVWDAAKAKMLGQSGQMLTPAMVDPDPPPAPEPAPERPQSVVEDFDSIGRRMREIREAEGRSAPV